MSVIQTLSMILPLYSIAAIGFVSAKYFDVKANSIAKLLIYIITPIITFYGATSIDLASSSLLLPFLFFFLCSTIALASLVINKIFYKDSPIKNLLAFTSGTGNTGYFGLPVILAVLGQEAFNIAIMSVIGFVIYENTLGFFLVPKGKFSVKASMQKVAKLPTIYAFIFGLMLNYLQIPISVEPIITIFKGGYSMLGLMVIGIVIAKTGSRCFDWKMACIALGFKFIFLPLVTLLIITLDKGTLNLFNSQTQLVMLFMSIVPLAANTVALATEFGLEESKIGLIVAVSNIGPILMIPAAAQYFI